jgi:hypothetical protein
MQRLIAIIGIQVYAVALAVLQSMGNVRTDEAKYLLNIPYPHPPLARWILNLTEALPFQEMLWRVVFATLLVQAVWLVWSMSRDLAPRVRAALCVSWLLSAAVVVQAGTIMMAPLTGLQGLAFAWLWMRRDLDVRRFSPWLALLWLASLFTAYQAALFLPLVIGLLRRAKLGWISVLLISGFPLGLAALYALSNPHSLASFVNAGTDNQGMTLAAVAGEFLKTWLVAGSGVLVLAGIAGMLRGREWMLLGTFLLLSLYTFASVHLYYAILFTPLLIAGCVPLLRRSSWLAWPLALLTFLGTAVLWPVHHPVFMPDPTRVVMNAMDPLPGGGDVLIRGSFGHDWQYESPVPVRTFAVPAIGGAQLVLCRRECPKTPILETWSSAKIGDWEVYKRP